jgi:Ca2+-binding RTX toxin-like protein
MSLTFVNTATIFDSGRLALSGAWGAAFATVGGSPYLYVGGYTEDGISGFAVSPTGQLTNVPGPGGNLHKTDHTVSSDEPPIGGIAGITSFSIGSSSYVCATAFTDNTVTEFPLWAADGTMSFPGPALDWEYGAFDVVEVTVGGNPFVVAAAYTGGALTSYRINPSTGAFVSQEYRVTDTASLNLAGVRSLSTAVIGGATYLFAAGQTDNGLSIFTIDSSGHLTPVANISDDTTLHLGGAAAVTTATVLGQTYIFAAGAGMYDFGISVFHFQPGTTPTPVFNVADTASLHLQDVYDLVTADIAGTTYLFAVGFLDNGVSAFAVAPDGTLVSVGNVDDTAGLALNHAAQLATTVIGGNTFLAVTGNADNGVSLFRIDAGGLTITGTPGADLVDATHTPAHQLLPGDLGDTIFGFAGNDVLHGLGGDDKLDGGDDSDTLDGDTGADTMAGGAGDDNYTIDNPGDTVDESVAGSSGIDTVLSATVSINLADAAHFKGGVENAALLGSAILDLTGNALANKLTGNEAANTLDGGGGNDTLDGGVGIDTLRGGPGNDTYVLGNGADHVSDSGGTADLVTTTMTRSLMSPGFTTIERLTLLSGNINGTGNNLNNTIIGSNGANALNGGRGNDTLSGGKGNDTLYGEAGVDRLIGGAGKDVFVFNVAPSFANRDLITDFSHQDDTIKLSHAFFKGIGTGPLKSQFFFTGTHAHDADDHIIYNKANGALYYDSDGTGAHAQVLFAVIANHASAGLAFNDFVLI